MEKPGENSRKAGEKQDQWIKWLVLGLALANFFVWLAIFGNSQRKYLEVKFFDVGQGDAAFAQLPNGVQILIDGGPGGAVLDKLGAAMPFYDRDIDWVVLSHADRDHLAGLLAVLKNYQVRNIIWSGAVKDNAESEEWGDLIAKEGANLVIARPGRMLVLGFDPDCVLKILAPTGGVLNSSQSANDSSVVARLVYGRRSFLFTGDATVKEEKTAFSVDPEPADVLKVAHHGSKTSVDEAFTAGLFPAAAVISAGLNNSYGHPHQETLDLLAKYDIKTLRTDQNGDIVFKTDGELLFLKTEK
ncbi:MAG: MBL fold metallo-hydrolase [Minisyncoccales bacterium]